MSKILVVFGATGQQGKSVIDYVRNDPVLSRQFSLRAVTRNATQPAAISLQKEGIEVIQADADDAASLPAALKNAHTVFIITVTVYDSQLKAREFRQGKAIADAAVAAGAEYIIFSSLVNARKLFGGMKEVESFDVKAEVEEYIRSLPVKSAFFAPGMFMQNFQTNAAPHPVPGQKDTYAIANIISPDAKVPLVDIVGDTGKYVGTILAAPQEYAGRILYAATKMYSFREIAEIISRLSGKKVVYSQIPAEVFAGFMPAEMAGRMVAMMQFSEDLGYYGPQTEELVDWTAKQVKGELTTFEKFAEKNKLV